MIRNRFMRIICIVGVVAGFSLPSSQVLGVHYFGAHSVEDYSGCDCDCGDLDYCNDQSYYFCYKMGTYPNWSQHGRLIDEYAYSTDFAEDEVHIQYWNGWMWEMRWGDDENYVDKQASLWFHSGHGGSNGGGNCSKSHYVCKPSGVSSDEWCEAKTHHYRLGEESGAYSSPYAGTMKWFVTDSCTTVRHDWAYCGTGTNKKVAAHTYEVVFEQADFHMVLGYHTVSWDTYDCRYNGYYYAYYSEGLNWDLVDAWDEATDCHDDTEPTKVTFGTGQNDAANRLTGETYWVSPYYIHSDPDSLDYYAVGYVTH